MIYTKYVEELSKDFDRLRAEINSFFIVSDVSKIEMCDEIGISIPTLYRFLNGGHIRERSACKIAHYLEKHLQKH